MTDPGYITQYRRLRRKTPGRLARRWARFAAVSALATAYQATGRAASLAKWHRIQFFCLHHIFEDERKPFRRTLDRLTRTHRFLSYSQAVRRILAGDIDGPYLVLSFDDGFKNCLAAGRILKDFDISAMFFVCGAMLGEPGEISHERVVAHCRQRLHMKPVEHMNWPDLEMLKSQGHEIGGHTMTHANLAQLPIDEVRQEVGGVRDLLVKRLGRCDHFAWTYGPFGAFSAHAAKAVFDAGYQSCASGVRGVHINTTPIKNHRQLCIRRNHLVGAWPISHVEYFMARNRTRQLDAENHWPDGWKAVIGAGDSKDTQTQHNLVKGAK